MSLTWLFCGKLAVQAGGQLIPGGLLLIVPVPAAGGVTVNWNIGPGREGEAASLPEPQLERTKIKKASRDKAAHLSAMKAGPDLNADIRHLTRRYTQVRCQ